MERDEIIKELAELSQEALRQAHERNILLFSEFDLSDTSIRILNYLSKQTESVEASKISEACGISSQAMTFPLDSLEKRGYLVRVPHPTDRRKKTIVLSERGKEIADNIHNRNNAFHIYMSQNFDAADLEKFISFRRKSLAFGRSLLEKWKRDGVEI